MKSNVPEGTKRYRKQPISDRFWKNVEKLAMGCWVWQGSTRQGTGYGQFNIDRYPEYAHRVSWALTYGPISDSKCVLHRCDNRRCVNPDHLFLGTKKDNAQDMISKGRDACVGERNHSCKLTDSQVAEIRRMVSRGSSRADVARAFKISHQYVSDLALNPRRRKDARN